MTRATSLELLKRNRVWGSPGNYSNSYGDFHRDFDAYYGLLYPLECKATLAHLATHWATFSLVTLPSVPSSFLCVSFLFIRGIFQGITQKSFNRGFSVTFRSQNPAFKGISEETPFAQANKSVNHSDLFQTVFKLLGARVWRTWRTVRVDCTPTRPSARIIAVSSCP